jgi:hypothetical protein
MLVTSARSDNELTQNSNFRNMLLQQLVLQYTRKVELLRQGKINQYYITDIFERDSLHCFDLI